MKEKDLYPIVATWMEKRFHCYKTAINKGLVYSRIDVVGIRDVGGDLSGEVETISIEVKKCSEPFATACGQALGYKIYANRVYLADVRKESFTNEEIRIASHLGLGLIQIKNGKCIEILTSPYYIPMSSHSLQLLLKLRIGKCQTCGSFFETALSKKHHRLSRLSRRLDNAIKEKKGFMFWNFEVSDRKYDLRIRDTHMVYESRFICPDCVSGLISKLQSNES